MEPVSKFFSIVVLSLVVACGGGGGESKPKPIKVRYDDVLIAQIALDQKQAVVKTQSDWNTAKIEAQKAEADFNEVSSQISIVKNDQKAAGLKVDSAKSSKKVAKASMDANKINAAENEMRTAELGKRAADARVKYYEAYKKFLTKHVGYTLENQYWREAQYELAKAQLGQANAIRPPKVNYAEFGPQEADRAKRTAKRRDAAASMKSKAASARDAWLKAQLAADEAAGAPSNLPDPMLVQQNSASQTPSP